MAIDPQEFAQLLGAEIVGEVPDVVGGPFGMARLAQIMHQRLTPSQGERPGRPTNPNWEIRPKVPMSETTAAKLAEIAAAMSSPERKVSPMQVAAQLLEEAVGRVGASTKIQETVQEPVDSPRLPEVPIPPAGYARHLRKTAKNDTKPKRKPAPRPQASSKHRKKT
jgi:hypothetical protein